MSKNIKKILLLVFVLVLIFLAYFLIQLNNREKNKNNSAASQNGEQNADSQEINPEAPAPRASAADFKPEMMTEAEKTEMKISPQLNIQVISRDENGKIAAYKIIKTQADIVNLNQ